jgi:mycothiol conjugate amidase Mca
MMTERLTLMAVHAHPDDECMSTGGVLARYAREGIRTVLVTATRGEEGEVLDPDMNPDEVKPKLGDVRTAELECACKHLQVEELHILGYRDSGMAGWETNNHLDCLAQADLHEATGRLVRLIRELRPHVITCYDETGGYGHPDHLAAYRHVSAAFDTASDPLQFPDEGPPWQPSRLFYTAMLRSFFQKMRETLQAAGVDTSDFERPEMQRLGYEDADVTTTIDVSDYTDAKQAAFRAHRTQFAADGPFSRLDAETQRAMFAYEHYILARPVDAGPVASDELFG